MSRRRQRIDDSFFDILTPESAWVLGVWLTDGSIFVPYNRFEICLSDEQFIRRIHELMKCEGKVGYREKVRAWRFQATSPQIAHRLVELGVTGNKIGRNHIPDLPDHLMPHLIRGIIDGDGSIHIQKHKPSYRFCTVSVTYPNRDFLVSLTSRLRAILDIKAGIWSTHSRSWYTTWFYHDSLALLPWMYKDSEGIRLERKYQIAEPFLELAKTTPRTNRGRRPAPPDLSTGAGL